MPSQSISLDHFYLPSIPKCCLNSMQDSLSFNCTSHPSNHSHPVL